MKVCVVSSYPPNKGNLSEYCREITQNLVKKEEIKEVIVLANTHPEGNRFESEENIRISRCWKSNSLLAPLKIFRKIKFYDPDIVYFNQHMMSWGKGRLINFLGGITPALVKLFGRSKVVVTLHNLGENVELSDIPGIKDSLFNNLGMETVVKSLDFVDSVTVTLESFKEILKSKYGNENVVKVPHGTWFRNKVEMDFSGKDILAFGFWSPTKELDLLLKTYKELKSDFNDITLTVAGKSHPNFPEYLERVKKNYPNLDVEYTGYVPSEKLKALFSNANLVILPYRSATGTSGVLNLAKSYGRPVLASNLEEIEEAVESEGGEVIFYDQGSLKDLKNKIKKIIENKDLQKKMSRANLKSASCTTFAETTNMIYSIFKNLNNQSE